MSPPTTQSTAEKLASIARTNLFMDRVRDGDLEALGEMIQSGFDPNTASNFTNPPLLVAAMRGRTKVMQFLLDNGANIHAKNVYGQTALHMCLSYSDRVACVGFLIQSGANINAQDDYGETPLHQGIKRVNKGGREVMESLLCLAQNGADFLKEDKYGNMPAAMIMLYPATPDNPSSFSNEIINHAQSALTKKELLSSLPKTKPKNKVSRKKL